MISVWPSLYKTRWTKHDLTPDSFAHPAKVCKGQAFRIVEHAIAEGWIAPGQWCLDPFAGIGGFALPLIIKGINYVGIELEPKHAATGQANIALWRKRYASMPNLGDATLLCGDSRTLLTWGRLEPSRAVDVCVGSPPYSESAIAQQVSGGEGDEFRKTGLSPRARSSTGKLTGEQYGASPGQLAAMTEGDLAAVISSPPYAGAVDSTQHGIDWMKAGPATGNRRRGEGCKHEETLRAQLGYGHDPSNLAALPEGSLEAACVVSSPPYEESNAVQGGQQRNGGKQLSEPGDRFAVNVSNLGNQSGDTFWSAARVIVANCYALLKPGGHAIWVVGPYCRKGRLIDFPDQWRQLCESIGFLHLHTHRCPKTETYGTQLLTNGEEHTETVERVSFFRRLANKKNGARVDYEDVICLEKA